MTHYQPYQPVKAARLKPPFQIYRDGIDIADASGHICTAESPEYAEAILAAIKSAHPEP